MTLHLPEGADKKQIEEDKLYEKFPDGIFKYKVLAIDEENVVNIKVGDMVVLGPFAFNSLMPLLKTKKDKTHKWFLCKESDIVLNYGAKQDI